MKDKEKQIEEISDLISNYYHNGSFVRKGSLSEMIYDKLFPEDSVANQKLFDEFVKFAKDEFNLTIVKDDTKKPITFEELFGKVFENSVVLSMEELEEKYEPSKKFMAVARELEDLKQNLEDKVVISKEEHQILVKTAQGKIGNMKATDFLKACISSGVMVEVSTEEQAKQAYEKGSKETAEKYKVAMMLSIQEMQKYLEIDEEQAKILYHHNAEIAKQLSVEIKE